MKQRTQDNPNAIHLECGRTPPWSVCIPSYKGARYIEKTVESVINQFTVDVDGEIIVVENPSSEGGLSERQIARFRSWGIRYEQNPSNIGGGKNWNRCLDLAAGDLIHVLHDDDFVLPGFYSKMKTAADMFQERGIYFCQCHFVNSLGETRGETPVLEHLERDGESIRDFVHYGNPVQCAGVVIRRSTVQAIGGFDEGVPYCIDWEYWIRCILNCGGAAVPEVLACYRVHENNATSSHKRDCTDLRQHILFARLLEDRYGLPDKNGFIGNPAQIAWKKARAYRQAGDIDAAEANEEFFRRCVRQEPILIQLARAVKHFVTAVRDSGAPDRSLKKLWKDFVDELRIEHPLAIRTDYHKVEKLSDSYLLPSDKI